MKEHEDKVDTSIDDNEPANMGRGQRSFHCDHERTVTDVFNNHNGEQESKTALLQAAHVVSKP